MAQLKPLSHRGRGALSNPAARFEPRWVLRDEDAPVATEVSIDHSRTVIARNDSPDIPFDRSLNPYRGCEHGCVYCFARPTHAYLSLSPGLDFETKILAKPDAPELLRRELARPSYRCEPLAMGTNTDPYQPLERRMGITRRVLEVLAEHEHPVTVTTKSSLVLRDLDLLGAMAARGLASVSLSITSLDPALASSWEPRAAAPARRLEAIRGLAAAGIPVGVLVSPIAPGLNDHELEAILERARDSGATRAGYLLLRLPGEVAGLFTEWIESRRPTLAAKVLGRIRQVRGGRMNDPRFGSRMRGQGEHAALLARRFEIGCRRLGLATQSPRLDTSRFRVPAPRGQRSLFGGSSLS